MGFLELRQEPGVYSQVTAGCLYQVPTVVSYREYFIETESINRMVVVQAGRNGETGPDFQSCNMKRW